MLRPNDVTAPGGDRTFFDPATGTLPDRVAARYESSPPAVPVIGTYVAGWAVLSAVFSLLGLLLVDVVLTGRAREWDASVSRWLADRRAPWLDGLTGAGTFIANTLPVIAVVAVCSVVLLIVGRWREAVFLAGALLLEVTVFLTANTLADRSRPDVPRLDSTPSTGSFPSGHAAATLALWAGLAIVVSANVRRRVVAVLAWAVAAVLAVTVAFARAYRGMHHVTDVAAGMALGIAALAVSLLAVRVVSGTVARHRARSQIVVGRTAELGLGPTTSPAEVRR
jgi:membrane-associated phospholipid phosphatase